MTYRQTNLFISMSKYSSAYLLTARGVAHLVVHGTSASTNSETTLPDSQETCGGVQSAAVQRRDGTRRLRDRNDDDDIPSIATATVIGIIRQYPCRPTCSGVHEFRGPRVPAVMSVYCLCKAIYLWSCKQKRPALRTTHFSSPVQSKYHASKS